MTWAFKQPLSGHAKVILLALADHADDDGICWPSISKIAAKAYVSERTAQRYIIELTDEGYLSTISRSAQDGSRMANKYVLHMAQAEQGEGDSLTPPGDRCVTTPGDTVVTTNEPSSLTINNKQTRACRVPEDFSPNASHYATAKKYELPAEVVTEQVEPFLDYWRAVPGAKGLGLDWPARYRTWLRNHANFLKRQKRHDPQNTSKRHSIQGSFSVIDAAIAERERQLERLEGGEGNGGEGSKFLS